jgi:hypothetical protein
VTLVVALLEARHVAQGVADVARGAAVLAAGRVTLALGGLGARGRSLACFFPVTTRMCACVCVCTCVRVYVQAYAQARGTRSITANHRG